MKGDTFMTQEQSRDALLVQRAELFCFCLIMIVLIIYGEQLFEVVKDIYLNPNSPLHSLKLF